MLVSLPPLTPDDPGTKSDIVVESRYWLRLVLAQPRKTGDISQPEDKPKEWWSSHPIFITKAAKGVL